MDAGLQQRFKTYQMTMETVKILPVGGVSSIACPLCGGVIAINRPTEGEFRSRCLTPGCWELSLHHGAGRETNRIQTKSG